MTIRKTIRKESALSAPLQRIELWPELLMVQKVEVVMTGPRRRRFSQDDKARIVAETLEPGATVGKVAERHAIAKSLIFGWRKAAKIAGKHATDCSPLLGTAADSVRQIEAELNACKQSMQSGRRRIRPTNRLKELVAGALGLGLPATRLARLTGLPRSTVKSWDTNNRAPKMPVSANLRELNLVKAPSLPVSLPQLISSQQTPPNVSIRVGHSVLIEMPIEGLTEAVLRMLIAAGGGK